MELVKENEKGKTFQADDFKILYRNKGSVSGDNNVNVHEVLYLVSGSVEITVEGKVWVAQAPEKFEIPANTYHKILALDDSCLLLFI